MTYLNRVMYGIMNLIGQMGGTLSFLYMVFGYWGRWINTKFMHSKLIRAMYYIKIDKSDING
jgi:hypothetical protein